MKTGKSHEKFIDIEVASSALMSRSLGAMSNLLSRLSRKWTRILLTNARIWIALAIVLTGVSGFYTVRLFANLRTDVEELLPQNARSVLDLEVVKDRLQATDSIALILEHPDPKLLAQFASELETKLRAQSKEIISRVESSIREELEFYQRRQLLFMEVSDLRAVEKFINDKIYYERQLINPLTFLENRDLHEPVFSFSKLEKKYASKTEQFSRYPDGIYMNKEGTRRVILVYPPSQGGFGITGALTLRKHIDQNLASMPKASNGDPVTVLFTGGIQNLIEEHEALVEDLILSTILVVGFVLISLFAYYRSFAGTMALMGSLLLGTLLTFSCSFFLVGYLNANSAFMASIVLGNGINFGIIQLARYIEERRAGRNHLRSLLTSIRKTWRATATAAMAAGLSYGSLMFTQFRGFSQFGIIGFTGMVFCWVATLIWLPVFLHASYQTHWLDGPFQASRFDLGPFFSRFVGRFAGAIVVASIVATGWLGFFAVQAGEPLLETDLGKLRSSKSFVSGSAAHEVKLDEILGKTLFPVVALANHRSDAEQMAQNLRKRIQSEPGDPLITHVLTIADFLPSQVSEKIPIFHNLERTLSAPEVRQSLSPSDRVRVKNYFTPEIYEPISSESLPPLIRSTFTEKSGAVGNLVVIEPVLGATLRYGPNLRKFTRIVREETTINGVPAPIGGQYAVSSDMIEAILSDGPKATLISCCSVILLLVFLFRRPKTVVLATGTLLLGVIWLVGLMVIYDLRINFLNFIALPITFGIGVDYGVNIFQRIQQDGDVRVALRGTAGAVGLASLTTIIGYSSLLIASNQAFVSFGTLAVLGELTCLLAALFTVPALLLTFRGNAGK